MENNKYFLYARKSTTSEDLQIQSLDDQVKIMQKKAQALWIIIVDIFLESKSAKDPWREQFNEMIKRIKNGEAKGILTWKLDRLARNTIDSWNLQYMLQNWILNKIIANDKDYTAYDSGLLMSVESWMANQYILDLKKAVRRWLNSKYDKGIRPSRAPIGYLNNTIEKIVILDPDRSQIVRKMWDLMLTWNYSIRKTIKTANQDWGLRTVKRRKSWGGELTKSSGERIFRNIFYTGHFYHNGELIKWAHDSIISLEEYDRVQSLLWKSWTPRAKYRAFSYTGMMKCWTCWCSITAETKNKYIKSTWETREYIYYHCTKKRKELACNEKVIRIESLEEQIVIILESIEIDLWFKKWVYEAIKENYNTEFEARAKIFDSLVSSIVSEEKREKNLTNMLLDELISKDDFTDKKNEIQKNIVSLKDKRDKMDMKWEQVMKFTEQVFDFTFDLVDSFNNWSIGRRKEMLSSIGKNFILKDWILWLDLEPWYWVIQTEYPKLKMEMERLEPTKKTGLECNLSQPNQKMFIWWVIRGSNPGPCP